MTGRRICYFPNPDHHKHDLCRITPLMQKVGIQPAMPAPVILLNALSNREKMNFHQTACKYSRLQINLFNFGPLPKASSDVAFSPFFFPVPAHTAPIREAAIAYASRLLPRSLGRHFDMRCMGYSSFLAADATSGALSEWPRAFISGRHEQIRMITPANIFSTSSLILAGAQILFA